MMGDVYLHKPEALDKCHVVALLLRLVSLLIQIGDDDRWLQSERMEATKSWRQFQLSGHTSHRRPDAHVHGGLATEIDQRRVARSETLFDVLSITIEAL